MQLKKVAPNKTFAAILYQPLPWPKSVDVIHQRQSDYVVAVVVHIVCAVVVAVTVVLVTGVGDASCGCQRGNINW